MYTKIESARLLYINLNQQKLRVEEYIHVRDAITNDGKVTDISRMVILPATYIGSPRHMHEYAQDAMTYVRSYGSPDLFITFTCNSVGSEIKELAHGQSPADRHDLINRVFRKILIKLIDIITKSCIYGEVNCCMYSIEWQKRVFRMAHILIWLKEKIRPGDVDNVIREEIPDIQQDPVLFEIVSKLMIYVPCGALNMKSPCMYETISKKNDLQNTDG
ncbi:hypothetical protein AVEN_184364-1 [Araneus ventricosus]|uniref:Helitron helicase-like domain-containing protein n=1 Tax=Araneus ventricosus TaxID=182803 RepID=A0A4Y2IA35_ARAVE|nr:hypothetical protein AVEN_184364-1 [Araneus ventricosus]